MILPTMIVGNTPTDQWTITDTSGTIINLTGLTGGTSGVSPCNFTVIIQDAAKRQDYIGSGLVTIVNAAQGKITYAWTAQDTTVPMQGYIAPFPQAINFNLFIQIIDTSGNVNTYYGIVQPMSRS